MNKLKKVIKSYLRLWKIYKCSPRCIKTKFILKNDLRTQNDLLQNLLNRIISKRADKVANIDENQLSKPNEYN